MAEVIANTAHYIRKIAPTILDKVEEWQYVYGTGAVVPASGIYRCTGCGDEITSNKGDKFPPQNRHQHTNLSVPVQWQLIVKTQTTD
ncbi:protein L [Pseudomonas sp. TH15]|uniref:protein L n=1 Tax=Pseudomonas sp. TH15 TaxID=2796381 RepID=UPI0019121F9C|nr:protein L [Pseudomonas sp. TH15]MBK5512280.1 protein L [Pseudomonas sp. TH15]